MVEYLRIFYDSRKMIRKNWKIYRLQKQKNKRLSCLRRLATKYYVYYKNRFEKYCINLTHIKMKMIVIVRNYKRILYKDGDLVPVYSHLFMI